MCYMLYIKINIYIYLNTFIFKVGEVTSFYVYKKDTKPVDILILQCREGTVTVEIRSGR